MKNGNWFLTLIIAIPATIVLGWVHNNNADALNYTNLLRTISLLVFTLVLYQLRKSFSFIRYILYLLLTDVILLGVYHLVF